MLKLDDFEYKKGKQGDFMGERYVMFPETDHYRDTILLVKDTMAK